MTNEERKEINEYLSEELFNEHISELDNEFNVFISMEDRGSLVRYTKGCKVINHGDHAHAIPDYCSNAMPVHEKLIELGLVIYTWKSQCGRYVCQIESDIEKDRVEAFGDTIHEAICRAAVEYLKVMEEK